MTLALNLLAPFLLTNLLQLKLEASAPSRVLNVSSFMHRATCIHFEDLEGKQGYLRTRAYGQSKLGLVLLTYEFARRLNGAGITVNALDPGFVATRIIGGNSGWGWKMFQSVANLVAISPQEGAQTVLYLASSPDVAKTTGQYFKRARSVLSSPASYDEANGPRPVAGLPGNDRVRRLVKAKSNLPQAWDDEADVVVVGFGGAGVSAAIEAAQNGARVVVLDRFHGGGATAASGAIIYAGGGTPYQQAAGYDDTPEEMYRYLKLEIGESVSDATLRRFCNESRDNLAWLEEAGVPFEASLCPYKTSYPTNDHYLYFSGNEQVSDYRAEAKPAPRGHRAKGPGISGLTLFQNLENRARDLGILLRTQTQVQRLILSQDGQIAGIEGRSLPPDSPWAAIHRRLSKINAKATTYAPPVARMITAALEAIMDHHARPYRARASRGIVLAAGGFIFDREMIIAHAPDYLRCLPLGTPGDDGSGIKLGQGVGGATAHLDRVSAWSFYVPPDVLMQGVLVNQKGERICSEDLYGATQGAHIAANGGQAYLVIDRNTYQDGVRKLRSQAALFQVLYMLPALLVGRKVARSLDALAAKVGISAAGLQATMSAYNTAARRGEADPLGKTPDRFVPQERPPFYAIDCSLDWRRGIPCSAMTLGGLVVDEETGQVLRTNGAVIDGLYAAGRNAVGVCSQSYVSGLSIADGVFSGRRAGRHAARAGERDDDQRDGHSIGRIGYHGLPGLQGTLEAQGPGGHHHPGPPLPQEQRTLCDL